jgi:hypothetical protein
MKKKDKDYSISFSLFIIPSLLIILSFLINRLLWLFRFVIKVLIRKSRITPKSSMGLSVFGVVVTLIGVIAIKWESRLLLFLLSHQLSILYQILLPQSLGIYLLPIILNARNSKLILSIILLRLRRRQQPQLLHGRPQLVAKGVVRLGRNVGRKR